MDLAEVSFFRVKLKLAVAMAFGPLKNADFCALSPEMAAQHKPFFRSAH